MCHWSQRIVIHVLTETSQEARQIKQSLVPTKKPDRQRIHQDSHTERVLIRAANCSIHASRLPSNWTSDPLSAFIQIRLYTSEANKHLGLPTLLLFVTTGNNDDGWSIVSRRGSSFGARTTCFNKASCFACTYLLKGRMFRLHSCGDCCADWLLATRCDLCFLY